MRVPAFWIGTIEVRGLGADELRRRIPEAVESAAPIIDEYNRRWVLGQVQQISQPQVVIGRLGLCRHPQANIPPETPGGHFRKETLDEVEDAQVVLWFVLDYTRWIAGIEERSDPSHSQVAAKLADIISASSTALECNAELNITGIVKPGTQALVAVRQLARVGSVSATLRPSNPGTRPEARLFDDHLRGMHAASAEVVIKSDERGLDPAEPLLNSALALVDDAYGTAVIEGSDPKGASALLSTDDRPLTVEVEIAEDEADVTWVGRLVASMRDALDRLRAHPSDGT
ncbi:MAG: hypothetical protein ACE149_02395 [Armatimonadota bacterium]